MASHFGVKRDGLFLTSPFVILNDVGMEPQLLVPLGFESPSSANILGMR